MYLSVRDRPASAGRTDGSAAARPVGRVVITLGLVSLLTDVSSESVAAILPLYLTAVVGLSPAAFGFIDGLYQGASVLVRLGGGWIADRTDRRSGWRSRGTRSPAWPGCSSCSRSARGRSRPWSRPTASGRASAPRPGTR